MRSARSGAALPLALLAGAVVACALTVFLVLRAAALAPDDGGKLFVAFPPGAPEARAFAAIVAAGGTPVRAALGAWGWVAEGPGSGFVGRLQEQGAIAAWRGAPGGMALAGCFAFVSDAAAPVDPLARALEARLEAGRP